MEVVGDPEQAFISRKPMRGELDAVDQAPNVSITELHISHTELERFLDQASWATKEDKNFLSCAEDFEALEYVTARLLSEGRDPHEALASFLILESLSETE